MADADYNVKAIISAQTSQFEKGMKNAQSSVNSLSSSISNITNLVKKAFAFTGVAVGTKAIVDFGKSCVQSATQATKQFNILDNTIKATGADAWTSTKEMDSMAKELSDSTNYSVTEIEKMQSVLLGFRDITGDTFKDASDAVLDMATVMGMDLTSAVQTVGKALDDPIKGLDSLRRQGFQFTDEQKAELAQMVKTGNKMEAQKVILDELARSYGGASKAGQDSFAKQRHAVENFKDALGGKLIPVVQVFAENNAKMINSLRELIENTDFTPVINVVTNLQKIFSNVFETIRKYVNMVGVEVKDFIDRFNFKPVISLIDTLSGVIISMFNTIKNNSSGAVEIFRNIKEALISFSNSETFQNITDFINNIVDGAFFLWDEIQDIAEQIRTLISDKVVEIWDKIKELFENSSNALAESGQDISTWGELFWSVIDNIFRIFQDVINSIKAILSGDWVVAWEYAKLAVMRVADNILDMISTIANAFPDLINLMIKELNKLIENVNKVRGWFGKDPFGLMEAFDSVDLSKKTGLAGKIEETEAKIKEITGRTADNSIKEIERISASFAGFTSRTLGNIGKLTQGTQKATKEQRKYFARVTSEGEKNYKAFSEWDAKLLQQRLSNLNEWSDEYHEISLDLIEQERAKAHKADTEGAEEAKINEYYNKERENEDKRFEKAKRERAKQTREVIIGYLKDIASKSIEIFKKVVNTIKNAFSTIVNFVKNIFSGIKNIFSKLFEFNIDDSLNGLLAFEDAVLTFFVETLPRLPEFFQSALGSILTLIQTLVNSIDWNQIKGFLDSIIKTFVTYAPDILDGIVDLFVGLVDTVANVLVENAPAIVEALGEMFFTIIEALPSLIENFITVFGTFLSELGSYIVENGERLAEDLSNIVESIVTGITNFITGGGWRNILQALLTIQRALEKAVTDNIEDLVDAIIEGLPDLIDTLIASIVSASQTLAKLIKPLLKLIIKLIEALVEIAFSDEVLDASLEVIEAFIEAIIDVLIKDLPRILPKLIVKITIFIVKSIPKIIGTIIKAIVKAFSETDWNEVGQSIYDGLNEALAEIGDALNELYRWVMDGLTHFLHGVGETLWSAFSTIGEGIWNFFTGVWTNISNFFSGVGANISNFFSSIGQGIMNIVSGIGSGITNFFTGVGNTFNQIGEGIKNFFQGVFDWLNNGWQGLIDGVNWAIGQIRSGFEWAFNGIKSFFDGIFQGITWGIQQIQQAFQWLKGGWDWFWGGPSSWFGWATGTNDAPRGLALVGEQGPELVRFNGGEQVLNTRNTQKLLSNAGNGSNGGNTFNVTFNNLQDTTAFAMMNQLKQYNRQMAINGVI